jgi:2-polyprenyl-3-methyl-5-hydroxy-6-metoxy-1,4-benzoquinol methylase
MMFGLRDEFEYIECDACGCLQNVAPPQDLAQYYSGEYYAFNRIVTPEQGILKSFFKRAWTRHSLGKTDALGWIFSRFYEPREFFVWARHANLALHSRVLDVGSGTGRLLLEMRNFGFENLTGVDPFVQENVDYGNGVRILRRELKDVEGLYDFVMMNHSFEHMPDPQEAMRQLRRILSPKGVAMVRIPVADSYCWRTYATDWVQLDAPRHLFLHTQQSMRMLAEDAGLAIASVIHDSFGFQFWGSEQYRRDVALSDPRSHWGDSGGDLFTTEQMQEWEAQSVELNRRGEGDQAAFYLRPV